ncbi:hypothetical protein [Sinobaca sp. H24]|uniref:WYL domain-containing protein n=1 Tax=Sinobaca sp. H24 TaxID=2923376 RepID=UPI0020791F2B|nr:hypothetical protein [Sinobaca sp. H24]
MEGILERAMEEQAPLQLVYESKSGITQRTITIYKNDTERIIAYCHSKKAVRSFRKRCILAVQPIKKRYPAVI